MSSVEFLDKNDIIVAGIVIQNLLESFCCVLGNTLTALFPAWLFWQAVLNFSHIFIKLKNQNKIFQPYCYWLKFLKSKNQNKKFQPIAIPRHLRKQVGVIAFPIYNASGFFLQVRMK